MNKSDLHRIGENLWEINAGTKPQMTVPARIYATEAMIDSAQNDKSFSQLMNVATLPGICNYALVMPDVHEGYGFPIGAVAATEMEEGVISPGGIGYDINCGIRLIKTEFDFDSIKKHLPGISRELFRSIPSGVGKSGPLSLSDKELDEVLSTGCRWAVKAGYAESADLEYIESNGSLSEADPSSVSQKAKQRGHDQLGTMGSGNHFVEINVIDRIFDDVTAKVFGLHKGQIILQIHTGSRGLGHQVATDYVKIMLNSIEKYGIKLPDRELSCAPIISSEGRRYFGAMCAAANFAWTNRQIITHQVREAWLKYFGKQSGSLSILYDVAHNIAKKESIP